MMAIRPGAVVSGAVEPIGQITAMTEAMSASGPAARLTCLPSGLVSAIRPAAIAAFLRLTALVVAR